INNEFDQIDEAKRQCNAELARKKIASGDSMRSHTIDLIMQTLFEKNPRENKHSNRVSKLCVNIGKMIGMNKEDLNELKIAGLMHDIGKIGIPEKILNKPGKLTNEEWIEMKRHSEIGYRILNSVPELSQVALYVLQHQEKWDGTGYPLGLKENDISLAARIICIADSYDAMTSERTYRQKMTKEEAIEELKRCSGTQFDPSIISKLLEHIDQFDI
ncbi:MAG: hypothetical protein CVV01_04730, partial [Firmicutes bacterium HGW-Firmicutes-6]